MEKDSVVVGLSYLFKLQYIDLKKAVERVEASFMIMDSNMKEYSTQLGKINGELSELSDSLNKLFDDMSGQAPSVSPSQ